MCLSMSDVSSCVQAARHKLRRLRVPAGCDDYTNALVEDPELSINKCPVGGAAVAAKLGEILGKSAEAGEKQLAVVMCNGTRDAVKPLLAYNDIKTCKAAKNLFGGMNACPFGCLGLGDCEAACDFDAIHICDGVAVVNKDACVACGAHWQAARLL